MWRLIFFLMLVGCNALPAQQPDRTVSARQDAENLLGFALPPGAADIHSFRENTFGQITIWARFDLPPDELPALLESMDFTEPLIDGLRTFTIDPLEDEVYEWWEPNYRAEVFSGAAYLNYDTVIVYEILVDKTDPSIWTVYLTVSWMER